MRTLTTLLATALLALVLSTPAFAGPGHRHGHEHARCPETTPAVPPGPDRNHDGRLSTYEKILEARSDRWNEVAEPSR